MQTLTPDQIRRVRDAVADCDRFIAKEGARDVTLRKPLRR